MMIWTVLHILEENKMAITINKDVDMKIFFKTFLNVS